MGPLVYPLCVTLIMRLTTTEAEASRLGAFSQVLGYALGACGPLLVGLGFAISGGWNASLVILACTGVLPIIAGAGLNRHMARASI